MYMRVTHSCAFKQPARGENPGTATAAFRAIPVVFQESFPAVQPLQATAKTVLQAKQIFPHPPRPGAPAGSYYRE